MLGDLFAEDLIYFFHHRSDDLNRDSCNPSLVLEPEEVDRLLAGDEWRTHEWRTDEWGSTSPLPATDVWFFATKAGTDALKALSENALGQSLGE